MASFWFYDWFPIWVVVSKLWHLIIRLTKRPFANIIQTSINSHRSVVYFNLRYKYFRQPWLCNILQLCLPLTRHEMCLRRGANSEQDNRIGLHKKKFHCTAHSAWTEGLRWGEFMQYILPLRYSNVEMDFHRICSFTVANSELASPFDYVEASLDIWILVRM